MTETDKEFVERIKAHIYNMPIPLAERDLVVALTFRGAETQRLTKACQDLLAGMTDAYTARNGRQMGIEADDGEKCWIVHSDFITELKASLIPLTALGEPKDE